MSPDPAQDLINEFFNQQRKEDVKKNKNSNIKLLKGNTGRGRSDAKRKSIPKKI